MISITEHSPDINVLLTPDFVLEEYLDVVKKNIHDAPNPIAYIVGNGYAQAKKFYPRVAHALGLVYHHDLSIPLDPLKSIAQRIPIKLFIKYDAYVYEDSQNRLIIAVSNPFITQEALQELLSYTEHRTAHLVMTHPNEIKEAHAYTYRLPFRIFSENYIRVFQPPSSVQQLFKYTKIIRVGFLASLTLLVFVWIVFPLTIALTIFVIINTIYFAINIIKFYVFYKALVAKTDAEGIQHATQELSYKQTPIYTVLVPLKNETDVVPQLVANISQLDYPKDKLDVKFAIEEDDGATRSALEIAGLNRTTDDAHPYDIWTQVIQIAKGKISTKPRTCNYALKFARGTYTVIYDAEDKPDPDQLKKAVLGFLDVNIHTICLQAKLNFYNWDKNWLTRFFSIEYGFWFEYFLSGLGQLRTVIPLGGTSNHFTTRILQKIGTWDAYNVTEDADLGVRISKTDFQTRILDSHTMEEAVSEIIPWIKQRTRWQKGFLVTYIVHMSHIPHLIQRLGWQKFIMFHVTFGANFFLPFLNPFLWILFILSLTTSYASMILPFIPSYVAVMAVFNLVVGNLTYIFTHLLATAHSKRFLLMLHSLLIPFYWLFISIATFRAFFQFLFDPYRWEKTTHGK